MNEYLVQVFNELTEPLPPFDTVKDEITLQDYLRLKRHVVACKYYIVTASTADDARKLAFALDGGFNGYREIETIDLLVATDEVLLALAKTWTTIVAVKHCS